MNTFMNQLKNDTNYGYTENGAVKRLTTNSAVYDLFALGAAYRKRSDADCVLLFKKAFEENEELALKCLFWIRDCRGGAGERRFFRICINWLANNYPTVLKRNITYIPEMGRYDDWFELFDTPLEQDVMFAIKTQLLLDMNSQKNGISLLAKWLPSENASSPRTKEKAKKIRTALCVTSKDYRKMLSKLREKIKVLEKLMSENRWDEIEFSKIPSKAGLIYKNAFARRDIIAKKYEAFAKDKNTKVNADTLYPYELVHRAGMLKSSTPPDDTDRLMINKYWENLPDYLDGKEMDMMCVVDTSGSMTWSGNGHIYPIDVAVGLGMYCAERLSGPFKNKYISFSSRPQLININGVDFCDKAKRIIKTNLCQNTNLEAVFDLLLKTVQTPGVKKEDLPSTIVIISDMEIDDGVTDCFSGTERALTVMESIHKQWERAGFTLPKLIYWNVNARNDTILDLTEGVSFVSGASPTIFKQVLTGKTGWELCLETICSERYENIHA